MSSSNRTLMSSSNRTVTHRFVVSVACGDPPRCLAVLIELSVLNTGSQCFLDGLVKRYKSSQSHLRDKRHSNQCFAFKKMQNILFWPKSILWKGRILQNEREFRLISSIRARNAVEAWHSQQFPAISVNVEHFMKQNLLLFKCGPAPRQQSLWGSLFCITHVLCQLFDSSLKPLVHRLIVLT